MRYLPIDIPKLAPLDFSGIQKENMDLKPHTKGWFDPIYVITEGQGFKKGFAKKNPHFFEWLQHLPVKEWVYASVQYQLKAIGPHIDMRMPNDNLDFYRNVHRNEPCGYRIVLNGSHNDVMYLVDDYGNKTYTKLPEDTNTYVINYTQGIHGTEFDEGRCVLLPACLVDDEKHKQIIERSVKKYSEYIIF